MAGINHKQATVDRGARMLRTALGPAISALLQDPSVVEVMLNPDGRIWVDRLSAGLADTGEVLSAADGERIVRLVAHHVGVEVHACSPRVSTELPETGERFEGLLPPVVAAPAFAIRKPAVAMFTLDDYVATGIMSADQASSLREAVASRANILVAGGTSTGKTTLINALLAEVAKTSDRVVIIEVTRELQCAAPNLVAMRTKDGVASLGAVALLGIGGALIYALQTRDAGPGGEELYSTENRPTADGLTGLPRDYTGPVLGPALPGDLGRPILEAERRGQPVAPPAITTPAADPEEQRRLAEEEATRLSGVFFQSGPRTGAPSDTAMPGLTGLGGQPTTQDRHAAFLNGPVDRQTAAPDRVAPPASPYILQARAVIPAALITGIRSDLLGQITAQVMENVYDSPIDSLLLIPQGTRIIGQYDDGVTFGQRRVLLVWNRLILSGGCSIVLERLPGADASGYAGLEDGVDYHWWDLMKAAGLSTLLAVGTELATSDEDRLIRAIRDGAQDTINQAGQQIVQRQLQVAPTLTIRPGFPIRIIVTRDLVFEPAGG